MLNWLKRVGREMLMTSSERREQAFLGQAVDLADLEWRLKESQSGRFHCPSYLRCH